MNRGGHVLGCQDKQASTSKVESLRGPGFSSNLRTVSPADFVSQIGARARAFLNDTGIGETKEAVVHVSHQFTS